jgi:hypothetical protein
MYEDAEASGRSTKDIINCWNKRNRNELKNDLPTVSGARQRLLASCSDNQYHQQEPCVEQCKRKNGKKWKATSFDADEGQTTESRIKLNIWSSHQSPMLYVTGSSELPQTAASAQANYY